MKHIYLFSGIGADYRAFQFLDFSGFEVTHIKWISNLPDEPIEVYARRILDQINTENPILIGLSFGGIMALEVAKLIATEKIIIIASVKTHHELPFYAKGYLTRLFYLCLPQKLLSYPNFLIYWLFGLRGETDKTLFDAIMRDTDPVFLKWALCRIAIWKNSNEFETTKHIHGTADRLFPFCFVKCDIPIKNGGHFMTVNMADELSREIRSLL